MGNNAKFIVEWGQYVTSLIIILSLFSLYLIVKNNKYYLPKGFLGYSAATILFLLLLIGSLAFAKVTAIKPRILTVLEGLESLSYAPAPPFRFNLLANDASKNITDYKGKVVLLNYWATWCAPCLKEMPELNRLQKNYKDQGLIVIALSDETKKRLLKFAKKNPFTVVAAYTKEFDWADIQSERPMTFLINKNGIIVDYFTGGYDYEYDYEFFESKIRKYLKE